MKFLTLSSIFLFLSFHVFAQTYEQIDESEYKLIYKYSYKLDSTTNKMKTYNMILFVAKTYDIFLSENMYLRDSVVNLNLQNKVPDELVSKTIMEHSGGPNYFITRKKNTNIFNVVNYSIDGDWEYSDETKPVWKLGNDKATIAGLPCQNAYTTFRGRKYTAWFSMKIPISTGPYKFFGLPACIVKISDKQNSHIFELVKFEQVKVPVIQKNVKTLKVKLKDIKRMEENQKANKIEHAKDWFGNDPEKLKRIIDKYNSKNNPIELNF